jgi:hypothetical protein
MAKGGSYILKDGVKTLVHNTKPADPNTDKQTDAVPGTKPAAKTKKPKEA